MTFSWEVSENNNKGISDFHDSATARQRRRGRGRGPHVVLDVDLLLVKRFSHQINKIGISHQIIVYLIESRKYRVHADIF